MESSYLLGDDFKDAVVHAGNQARLETLEAGVPVFYRDFKKNIDIMEEPNGRKYQIQFIPGAPGDRNFKILREVIEAES